MPMQVSSKSNDRLDATARRAASELSGGIDSPPDDAVAHLYASSNLHHEPILNGATPPEVSMRVMPYGPRNSVADGPMERDLSILILLEKQGVDLAVWSTKRRIFYKPDAIASVLRQAPQIRDYIDWKILIYSLVVFGFRVARITLRKGQRIQLDTYDIHNPTLADLVRDLKHSPGRMCLAIISRLLIRNHLASMLSLLLILVLDAATWFGWINPTGWSLYLTTGIVFLLASSLFLSELWLGVRRVWAILAASSAFLSYIAVLWFKGFL